MQVDLVGAIEFGRICKKQNQDAVAKRLQMTRQCYSRRLSDPDSFSLRELKRLSYDYGLKIQIVNGQIVVD